MRPTLAVSLFVFSALCPLGANVDSVVVFNEIHYHPGDGSQGVEFVELYNQNSVNVDLSGWMLQGAGDFVFEKGTTIEGRSFLVVAKDPSAIAGALGPLAGALANNGEMLTLRNHNGRIMDRMDFRDSWPWPTGPDGSGATLAKRLPTSSSGRSGHWSASRAIGGTPGEVNDTGVPRKLVVFSEAPASTEKPFWIELFNAGEAVTDLGTIALLTGSGERVLLSDSLAPRAYSQVPLEVAPAEGMRVFLIDTATDEFLDAVILQNRPRARVDFPDGRFLQPQAVTPGAANDVQLEDRIVINEIMYHHRPDYEDPDDPSSVFRENDEEWIELVNRSEETVDLSGWRIRDGIRYDFHQGVALEPGAFLVVAKDAAALARKYPEIAIVGDFRGTLANGDDRTELQDALGNPADVVHYFDEAPWPADADGGGSSLELKHPEMDNSPPEAWTASDESLKSEWHTYTYRAVARRPVYTAGVRNFHELRIGYIQAGRCLMDNVSVVVEDADGARIELVRNRSFGSLFAPNTSSHWRLIGNHDQSQAVEDPDAGAVLEIVAGSSMNYLNNLCEASLSAAVDTGKEYQVSFDAKWLSGSPQLRTEIYYSKIAKKHILIMPEKHGTPGRRNTAYLENPGPTFHGLRHHPPVPKDAEAITVSVVAGDPDGIETLTLYYSVDEEDWQRAPMTPREDEYHGTIPGQEDDAVIQFYIQGVDIAGGRSAHPADGPDSGAFVRVDGPANTARRQSMRLILRDSDNRKIHDPLLILSNRRRDCTVIMNETDITYGCALRLRGSMFSRGGGGDSGLNIKFPADRRFRGVQPTVIVRRRNPQEILVKHMANQAVDVPASYNDFVELRGYRSGQSGLARMEMARFGENYLGGAFENGERYPVFKLEGIRDFQQTGAGGIKRPTPIGWIQQFDLRDLGDDKEQYRHVLRMINARRQDNYSPMIDLCQAFSAPDDELRESVEAVIDTDQWARTMAVQMLCGIADVYPIENPHNLNMYRRPTDGKIIAIPWDWDFTFNLAANSRSIDPKSMRKNLWRVLTEPGINRLYRGHLLDLIDTVFNETYAEKWFSHYASVAGTSYNSQISYVRSRGNAVKSQATSQTPFRITTNDGADLSVDTPQVTLEGKASVRVDTIEHVEPGLRLEPYWIDDETWKLTLPLSREVNVVSLQARDYRGSKGLLFNPAGSDSITVTNTGHMDAPRPDTLLISEIMYHPSAPSPDEVAAGFEDQDYFEFIELVNIGSRSVDLRSLTFSAGVQFDFTGATQGSLEPGGIGLLVADPEAFTARYGSDFPVLGAYTGNLANGGERLTLSSLHGRLIQSFSFDDRAPWPEAADGIGASLTLADLTGEADANAASAWRASSTVGGTPGRRETTREGLSYEGWLAQTFTAEERARHETSGFEADPDGDGFPNGVEFALGLSPHQSDFGSVISIKGGEAMEILFPKRLHAGAIIAIETSADLQSWQSLAEERVLSQHSEPKPDGATAVHRTIISKRDSEEYLRLHVLSP